MNILQGIELHAKLWVLVKEASKDLGRNQQN
jgi:hypothetical protein